MRAVPLGPFTMVNLSSREAADAFLAGRRLSALILCDQSSKLRGQVKRVFGKPPRTGRKPCQAPRLRAVKERTEAEGVVFQARGHARRLKANERVRPSKTRIPNGRSMGRTDSQE